MKLQINELVSGTSTTTRKRRCIDHDTEWLSVDQAADVLGVSKSFIYERTQRYNGDALPHYKVGKFLRFKKSELLAWAAQDQR